MTATVLAEQVTKNIKSGIMNESPNENVDKGGSLTPLATELDGISCLKRFAETPEESFSVSYLDIVLTVISIVLRVASIVLNILLAVEYFRMNKWNYFVWTTCCIVIPMVITTMLGIHIYLVDRMKKNKKTCMKFVWLVVMCPFLFRYYKSLKYAIISKKAENKKDLVTQKEYYKYMVEEETDVALIRIFESSLEAAPQKILQISIYLAGEDKMTWLQFLAICGCFGSLTWCVVVYHKYNRATQPDKERISFSGMIVQILWYFCIYVSRILCIATSASVFPIPTISICCVHAVVLCIVILFIEKPAFCANTIFHRIAFALTIGVVFIFTYISLKDVRTRYRYALYYTVCAIENLAFIGLFFFYADSDFKESIVFIPLCVISIIAFYIGIIFMILYYKQFHPNITARNKIVSNGHVSPNSESLADAPFYRK